MKKGIIILSLLFASFSLAQTRLDTKIVVDSVERQFILVKPSGALPAGGYPLVFMLHGSNQTGAEFYADSKWKEKAEAEKFIAVFPQAQTYCMIVDGKEKQVIKWSNAELLEDTLCPGVIPKNDVTFFRRMLDTIRSSVSIDPTRIYAAGFSSGGTMVSKLAMEMSDVFSAIAYSGAILLPLDSAKPLRKIPLLNTEGSRDSRLLGKLGVDSIPFNETCLQYFAQPISTTIGALQLASTYTKDSNQYSLTFNFTTPTKGSEAGEYHFSLIRNMGHLYPNGSNYPIAATDLYWDFFKTRTLPLSVPFADNDLPISTIYPNPATDFITINENATLTLYSSTGNEVFRVKATQGERVTLPKLCLGVYVAKIEAKGSVKLAKVMVK